MAPPAAEPSLTVFQLREQTPQLIPAAAGRGWMDVTNDRFANRCLPLLMANQSGWSVLSPHAVRVTWGGGMRPQSLKVEYLGDGPRLAESHFGHGILTWRLPFLFRTSPGYNLLVRGPANWPKDGAAPLEGLVETDWAVATITANWQITRRRKPIIFEEGEPFCMVVPQRRGELESVRTALRPITAEPATEKLYKAWREDRNRFIEALKDPESDAVKAGWQKEYFRGRHPDGKTIREHQSKLFLKPFEDPK